MKVYLSNYRNHWLSPYTILEKVCFWEKDKDAFYNLEEHPNNKYEKWVKRLEPICKAWQQFLDFVHPRVNYVKIDRYDTWNMDSTLALIVLPMLKQLKETKHGSQTVDIEDVPVHLRTSSTEEWDDQKTFDFYQEHDTKEGEGDVHARWDWVLDEMIFAFESFGNDWEAKYYSGKFDMKSEACEWDENGKATLFKMVPGPDHTSEFDHEGMKKENDRIDNGLRLFGKYFKGLWD